MKMLTKEEFEAIPIYEPMKQITDYNLYVQRFKEDQERRKKHAIDPKALYTRIEENLKKQFGDAYQPPM